MKQVCQTCEHWDNNGDIARETIIPSILGVCRNAQYHRHCGVTDDSKAAYTLKVLWTGPEFGCLHWVEAHP